MWKNILVVLAAGAIIYYGLSFANKMFYGTVNEIKKGEAIERHFMLLGKG